MDYLTEEQRYEIHTWTHHCGICKQPECKRCGPHFHSHRIDLWPVWAGIIKPNVQPPLPDRHPTLDRFSTYAISRRYRLYELTLTVDITKFESPREAVPFLLNNFSKIINSKQVAAIDWIRVIELHKNGYPHIHALIATTKQPQSTKITAMYPYRASMSRVKDLEKYVRYIYKEQDNPTVQAFCDDNATTQIQSKETPGTPQPNAQA